MREIENCHQHKETISGEVLNWYRTRHIYVYLPEEVNGNVGYDDSSFITSTSYLYYYMDNMRRLTVLYKYVSDNHNNINNNIDKD